MRRSTLLLVTMGIFSLGTLAPAFAQDPATKSPNANPPADTASGSASGTAAKPKKVWTNDDMASLDHHGDVSIVGKRKPPQPVYHANDYARNGNNDYRVKYYRQQIDYLQQQADQIDKQISTLQDAKSGKTVDSERTYNPWGGVQGDWNAQISQLQKNKENVETQIDSLEEALRKLGP
jgi:hypothetical protein